MSKTRILEIAAALITVLSFVVWAAISFLKPPYVDVNAHPNAVLPGELVEIRWESKNAEFVTVRIDDGTRTMVQERGLSSLKVDRDTTITMEASTSTSAAKVFDMLGLPFTATKEAKVTIVRPPSVKLWTDPSQIFANERFLLRWNAPGAQYVLIAGIEPSSIQLPPTGERELCVDSPVGYAIVAVNRAGQSLDRLAVTPNYRRPTITLSAAPGEIETAGTSVLAWRAEYADVVELEGVGSAPTNGTQELKPTRTTTYRAIARSAHGSTEASVTIYVHSPRVQFVGIDRAPSEAVDSVREGVSRS